MSCKRCQRSHADCECPPNPMFETPTPQTNVVSEPETDWTGAHESERKTVHAWLNDLSIPITEFDKPICLLRRLKILCDDFSFLERNAETLSLKTLIEGANNLHSAITASPQTNVVSEESGITQSVKALLIFINKTPVVLSCLYDIDLMPEQVERGTNKWINMLTIASHFRSVLDGKSGSGIGAVADPPVSLSEKERRILQSLRSSIRSLKSELSFS